jgi:CDP-4-dehydro-6-deoxyglucose reductase
VSSVTVDPDGVEVALLDGETILAGLYRSGYAYRTGCRRGGCGICKVDLVSGDVDYTRTVAESVLSEDERASGTCLTCRAVPRGDVTIALRDEDLRRVSSLLARYAAAAAGD